MGLSSGVHFLRVVSWGFLLGVVFWGLYTGDCLLGVVLWGRSSTGLSSWVVFCGVVSRVVFWGLSSKGGGVFRGVGLSFGVCLLGGCFLGGCPLKIFSMVTPLGCPLWNGRIVTLIVLWALSS